jgi:molecular chaperone DnaK (HSP70)
LIDASKTIEFKPKWFKGYLRHATALKNMLNFQEARESVLKGLLVDPNNIQLKNLLNDVEHDIRIVYSKPITVDFGIKMIRMGYEKDGKYCPITNIDGESEFPAFISFTKRNILFGKKALEELEFNPKNTIFRLKDILQRNKLNFTQFDELFKYNGEIELKKTEFSNEYYTLKLTEIFALVFFELKKICEFFFMKNVFKLTLVVPAIYDTLQREILINATKFANFKDVRLISETNASAVSVIKKIQTNDEKTFLIINFGASKLEVSVILIYNQIIETKSYGGIFKGGNEIDKIVADYFSSKCGPDFINNNGENVKTLQNIGNQFEFVKEGTPKNLSLNSYFQLLNCCENIKKQLSSENEVKISLETPECSFELSITREKFNDLTNEFMNEIMKSITEQIKYARQQFGKIDFIIASGGCSKIPIFLEMLKIQETATCYILPPESVIKGATVYQYQLESNKEFLVLDEKYSKIWLGTNHTKETKLISKFENTIPSSVVQDTSLNVGTTEIKLYEGRKSNDAFLVNTFDVVSIPTSKGLLWNKLRIDVDRNGVCCIGEPQSDDEFRYIYSKKDQNELNQMYGNFQMIRLEVEKFEFARWYSIRNMLVSFMQKNKTSDIHFLFV